MHPYFLLLSPDGSPSRCAQVACDKGHTEGVMISGRCQHRCVAFRQRCKRGHRPLHADVAQGVVN